MLNVRLKLGVDSCLALIRRTSMGVTNVTFALTLPPQSKRYEDCVGVNMSDFWEAGVTPGTLAWPRSE